MFASPTIENSNRMVGWLRGMDYLRVAVGGGAARSVRESDGHLKGSCRGSRRQYYSAHDQPRAWWTASGQGVRMVSVFSTGASRQMKLA
jgi:hypothetical protein